MTIFTIATQSPAGGDIILRQLLLFIAKPVNPKGERVVCFILNHRFSLPAICGIEDSTLKLGPPGGRPCVSKLAVSGQANRPDSTFQ
jgi:hypothetical protein